MKYTVPKKLLLFIVFYLFIFYVFSPRGYKGNHWCPLATDDGRKINNCNKFVSFTIEHLQLSSCEFQMVFLITFN